MENNNQQPKKVKFFNVIALDKVVKQASDTPRRTRRAFNKEKIDKKVGKLKDNYINTVLLDKLDTLVSDNSIDGYLNECHPDIRKFIENNGWEKIVAETDRLIVTTKNRFRIIIGNISRYSKSINIKDDKGTLIFNGVQTINFK